MILDQYELKAGGNLTTFVFISEGPKGCIPKIIQFTPSNVAELYNLAFGDRHPGTGRIDDTTISNNRDSDRILATVVASVYAFTQIHPDAWIYATGSTPARTRLYRMGISRYLQEGRKDFIIYGQFNNQWELFEKSKDYEAFVVKRKFSNFEE